MWFIALTMCIKGLVFLRAAHVLITQEFQGVKTGKGDVGGRGRHIAG